MSLSVACATVIAPECDWKNANCDESDQVPKWHSELCPITDRRQSVKELKTMAMKNFKRAARECVRVRSSIIYPIEVYCCTAFFNNFSADTRRRHFPFDSLCWSLCRYANSQYKSNFPLTIHHRLSRDVARLWRSDTPEVMSVSGRSQNVNKS